MDIQIDLFFDTVTAMVSGRRVAMAGWACLMCCGMVWGQPPEKPADKPEEKPVAQTFEQAPEVQPAQTAAEAAQPVQPSASQILSRLKTSGPAPTWIWGPDANRRYFMRKTFTGTAKLARVFASCDNEVTVSINGKQVLQHGEWQAPAEADVTKLLQPGENVIVAEVTNAGGPAAFLLKLVLQNEAGLTSYIVSDESWQVAEQSDAAEWGTPKVIAAYGAEPWGAVLENDAAPSSGIPRGTFQVLPGFQVERLYTVPKDELGSWVSICVDNKGRLIVSDQGDKGLCRITPPTIGSDEVTRVERLSVPLTAAHGLLYAFDSLYVSVNGGPGSGIYRCRDTDGDDQFDEVLKLRSINGGGEHGPHSLRLSPDGQSIYMIAGNYTQSPEDKTSRVPMNWSEDHLLPRQWDANGHAAGLLAPGGWIGKMDPEGKTFELISMGYRNPFDFAFHADGEIFAYDADMEWDFGMPWYRPTRVVHATSGSEFGWRSGTGKWPTYFVDSLPPAVNIGPGSPVGVTFGYGAKFPARYQQALFILDWTFGTIYAIHIEPEGASYKAVKEEFVSRTPLPLTDVVIGNDGAMYFTVGGRGTQSELYRVTYVGEDPTAPVEAHNTIGADLRELRHQLEARHVRSETPAEVVEFAWPYLRHPDRFIRFAARIAIEHQPVESWSARALAETDPETLIQAAVALARQGDSTLQQQLLAALDRLEFAKLTETQQLAALRAWQLVFTRMGNPTPEAGAALAQKLDAFYPAASELLNCELCTLLVYLQSPTVIAKTTELLKQPSKPDAVDMADLLARNPGYGGTITEMLANQPDAQRIHYAMALRNMKTGWTLAQRKAYFDFLNESRTKKGGASYQGFIRNIDREAFENAPEAERLAIEASGARPAYQPPPLPTPMGPGKAWTLDEVVELAQTKLKTRNFKNGQQMFAAARCVICHRFAGDGGATGPDLTQLAGRFNTKDLTEAIVDPSKVISDQYKAVTVATTGGQVYTGKLLSQTDEGLTLLTDPENPTKQIQIPKMEIDELQAAQISLMPADLLKALNEDEVLDLLAYLLSRGNPNDQVFK